MKRFFEQLGNLISRRAVALIAIAALITIVMAYGVTRIEVKTSVDMLLSKDDPVSVNNAQFQSEFGGESLILLIRGEQQSLFSGESLTQLNSLQQALAEEDRVYSVTSPISLANVFAAQSKENSPEIEEKIGQLSAANEKFVRSALFDDKGGPQAAVAQLLPENGNDALFNIQLEPGLNMQEMSETTENLERIIDTHPIENVEPLFSGIPAISKALEDAIAEDIGTMLITVIVLMVIVLAVVFPVRWRLISLPVVLAGMVWTFGLMGFLGLPLSIATMALLPILIGLGTDFALQFHNRYEEELEKTDNSGTAIASAASNMGPAVGIAVGIMAIGFLTLLLSDMPMIKDFGAMLAAGVLIMYILGLLLLLPILSWRDRKGHRKNRRKSGNTVERLLGRLAGGVIKRPAYMLLIPVLLAIAGFGLDHKLNVESNIEKLMPQDAPELAEMNRLRDVLGSTLTIDWMVRAENAASPEVLQWMERFGRETAERYPQVEESTSIASALETVQPGIVQADTAVIATALDQLPAEMTSPYLSEDRRMARISFVLSDMDTKAQERWLEEMEQRMDPPAGVSVDPVGIQVLQIKSLNGLTDSRHTSLLSGLLAIFIGLFFAYRNLKRAFFPVLPIILVNGWSAGVLYVLGIDINPLTAVLGALVLGIGTEFTILLMERYLEEKEKGQPTSEAIVTAMTKVGRAITASGLTVVGGFSALIFTNFEVVKSFGISTVLDTSLCLLSTLTVLPAIIVLLDQKRGDSITKSSPQQ